MWSSRARTGSTPPPTATVARQRQVSGRLGRWPPSAISPQRGSRGPLAGRSPLTAASPAEVMSIPRSCAWLIAAPAAAPSRPPPAPAWPANPARAGTQSRHGRERRTGSGRSPTPSEIAADQVEATNDLGGPSLASLATTLESPAPMLPVLRDTRLNAGRALFVSGQPLSWLWPYRCIGGTTRWSPPRSGMRCLPAGRRIRRVPYRDGMGETRGAARDAPLDRRCGDNPRASPRRTQVDGPSLRCAARPTLPAQPGCFTRPC
jgi:hypothetical protein